MHAIFGGKNPHPQSMNWWAVLRL
ncbi:MAG: hypothetical protein R2861_03480 [Desulfobacterales bacterium]